MVNYFIDLFLVSGHLDQFEGSLFLGTTLIIVLEWVDPPPPWQIPPNILIFVFNTSLIIRQTMPLQKIITAQLRLTRNGNLKKIGWSTPTKGTSRHFRKLILGI